MGLFAAFGFYMIPSLVAFLRGHRNYWPITALNFLLGWTGIAWIAALVWALTANTDESERITLAKIREESRQTEEGWENSPNPIRRSWARMNSAR